MGEPIRKFVNRPTRYFFNPDDDHFIKFSKKGQLKPLTAEMLNISSTGIAFIIDKASSPREGDSLKLEFNVPGGEPMAWWGTVRRVMDFKPHGSWATTTREDLIGLNMIGIEFEDFPIQREKQLNDVLDKYFSTQNKEEIIKTGAKINGIFAENWGKFLLIGGCCIVIFYVLSLLSSL